MPEVTATEVLDELIADLKRREGSLAQLIEAAHPWARDLMHKAEGVRIAIDLLESRRKGLPEDDRAEIRQELEEALRRQAELGYSMTKAITALIERMK